MTATRRSHDADLSGGRRPGPRRPRRGNGVLEAALVLPVLLSLSMGMVEFGQFLYVRHTIQAASRDGARAAIVGSVTHAQAQAVVTATMATANIAAGRYTVTFQNAATNATIADVGTAARGTSIRVTVSAVAGNVTVRPLGVIPPTKPVVGITTMIKE